MSGGMPVPQLKAARARSQLASGTSLAAAMSMTSRRSDRRSSLSSGSANASSAREARIAALVDGVAEAGHDASVAQHVVEGAGRAVTFRHGQQLVGLLARASVQRARPR